MAVEVGQEAPDFTLRDENGEEVELSSLRGRNVVLIFFPAAFSGICTKELHTATDLAEKYGAAGAEVFGVSVDSPYALKAFKRGLEALIRDDFPTCIGFLQQGIHLNKQNATLNDDMSQLIERVRDGSVIAPPSVPAPCDDFSRYGEPSGTRH